MIKKIQLPLQTLNLDCRIYDVGINIFPLPFIKEDIAIPGKPACPCYSCSGHSRFDSSDSHLGIMRISLGRELFF